MKKKVVFLVKHNFSREEIQAGVNEVTEVYLQGMEGILKTDMFGK